MKKLLLNICLVITSTTTIFTQTWEEETKAVQKIPFYFVLSNPNQVENFYGEKNNFDHKIFAFQTLGVSQYRSNKSLQSAPLFDEEVREFFGWI